MEALRRWREGLAREFRTYEAAGNLLGVSGPQMYRYENGLRRIPAEKVKSISKVTGIPEEVLRPDVFGPPRPLKRTPKATAHAS
jgi:DNA-binding transcriptional regulator YdaS (Cro superfamily)